MSEGAAVPAASGSITRHFVTCAASLDPVFRRDDAAMQLRANVLTASPRHFLTTNAHRRSISYVHRLLTSWDMPRMRHGLKTTMLSVRCVSAPVTKVNVPVQSGLTSSVPSNGTFGRKVRSAIVASKRFRTALTIEREDADRGDIATRKQVLPSDIRCKHPLPRQASRVARTLISSDGRMSQDATQNNDEQ